MENGANPGDARGRACGERVRQVGQEEKEERKKRIRARRWKRRADVEKKRPTGTYKGFRTTETHGRYICGLYTAGRILQPIDRFYRNSVFFPEAPYRSSPMDSAHGVVSRKRLPDYVCPATDEDANDRTSDLYIVPLISPDLKLPRDSSSSPSPHPSLSLPLRRPLRPDRPVCLPLSRLYIDRDATSSPMYPSVRSSA